MKFEMQNVFQRQGLSMSVSTFMPKTVQKRKHRACFARPVWE